MYFVYLNKKKLAYLFLLNIDISTPIEPTARIFPTMIPAVINVTLKYGVWFSLKKRKKKYLKTVITKSTK